MERILDVKNLQVEFMLKRESIAAVEDISFHLDKGKTLCIVGESGCGKSVTATSIMRLYDSSIAKITKGSILFNGMDLVKCNNNEIRKIRGKDISMIFQEPMTSLNPVYTIGRQMIEMILAHKKISKKEAFEYAVEMLDKVKIPEPRKRMNSFPHQFSGGMRQRVMIAMALSCRPQILIADEPITALDVTIQRQILNLIEDLKSSMGTSVILITHDMGVVAEMADDTLVMYAGKVVEYNNTDEIFRNPQHPYTRGLLKSIPHIKESVEMLPTIKGTVPTLTNMPDGCRFSNRCPYCFEKCKEIDAPLFEMNGGLTRCWLYGKDK
ncbi:MAG TPA: ABC transporter ATP-binding protein [Sphaerochaeta sp.]|jgi:oligopeptide/dipeptide ABC transporter ATP-binding protein|nr:ABC transporter ATP-binding protein [Sphaerochaeta sp.]HQB05193.1 ABC transporter ATP-binding protein [Sphaerochaeta sp.]